MIFNIRSAHFSVNIDYNHVLHVNYTAVMYKGVFWFSDNIQEVKGYILCGWAFVWFVSVMGFGTADLIVLPEYAEFWQWNVQYDDHPTDHAANKLVAFNWRALVTRLDHDELGNNTAADHGTYRSSDCYKEGMVIGLFRTAAFMIMTVVFFHTYVCYIANGPPLSWKTIKYPCLLACVLQFVALLWFVLSYTKTGATECAYKAAEPYCPKNPDLKIYPGPGAILALVNWLMYAYFCAWAWSATWYFNSYKPRTTPASVKYLVF